MQTIQIINFRRKHLLRWGKWGVMENQVELSILTEEEKKQMDDYANIIVDYRRTGISLNHIIGCPINCAYCVRHFWGNFDMKTPKMLCSDQEAVRALLDNKLFVKNNIPIQFLHKATDPFLPGVKDHTFCVLRLLDDLKLQNVVMLITRYKLTEEDIYFLEHLNHIKVCLFYTYSGIKNEKIEPLSSKGYAVDFANMIKRSKRNRLKIIQYWRPVVNGWNDDNETINQVLEVSEAFDAIVIKGLRHKEQNDIYFKENGITINHKYGQYQKILTNESVKRILDIHERNNVKTPVFFKTSCAISYCMGLGDYNLNIKVGKSCANCSRDQKILCEGRLPEGNVQELEKILNKKVLTSHNKCAIENGTKEETLFARHFLQREVTMEVQDDRF